MQCVNCQTDNADNAKECVTCRAPLGRRRRADLYRTRKYLVILTLLLAWVGTFAYFFRDAIFPPGAPVKPVENAAELQAKKKQKILSLWEAGQKQRQTEAKAGPSAESTAGIPARSMEPAIPAPAAVKQVPKEVVTGWVIVVSPWGQQIAKVRSAAVEGGWLALPSRAGLGGDRWYFQADRGGSGEIDGGQWQSAEPVGLWHVGRTEKALTGPALQPWQRDAPLRWISLETDGEPQAVALLPIDQQGSFYRCTMGGVRPEAGVFIQSGAVVGWSFGAWSEGAWMWTGRGGEEPRLEAQLADFYALTFANGREEQFGVALAMSPDHSLLERLSAFGDGFRRAPKLALEDTPYPFLPTVVLKTIRGLVAEALGQGMGASVVEIFTPDLLLAMADPDIFVDLLPAILKNKGYEYTAELIEQTGSQIVRQSGRDKPALNEFHLQLYRDWLASLIASRDKSTGWQILNTGKGYYGDDPDLHLMQVELVLMDGDWATAEQLLAQRSYPPTLLDKRERLAAWIADLKGQVGKIVINFPPGATRIPVAAVANGALAQNFLLDTGASMVTIPYATAQALGLSYVNEGGHGVDRMVATAGGMVAAREVIIPSLEIGGWVEYKVRALVMDLPGQPGLGLLGLNYLSRFQMDLRSDQGRLLLTPR